MTFPLNETPACHKVNPLQVSGVKCEMGALPKDSRTRYQPGNRSHDCWIASTTPGYGPGPWGDICLLCRMGFPFGFVCMRIPVLVYFLCKCMCLCANRFVCLYFSVCVCVQESFSMSVCLWQCFSVSLCLYRDDCVSLCVSVFL